jgi:hypothetical protein
MAIYHGKNTAKAAYPRASRHVCGLVRRSPGPGRGALARGQRSSANPVRSVGTRRDACTRPSHGRAHSPAKGRVIVVRRGRSPGRRPWRAEIIVIPAAPELYTKIKSARRESAISTLKLDSHGIRRNRRNDRQTARIAARRGRAWPARCWRWLRCSLLDDVFTAATQRRKQGASPACLPPRSKASCVIACAGMLDQGPK